VGENITNGLGRTVLTSSTIGSSTPEYAFGSRRRRDSMPRGDLVDIIRDGQYPPGTLLNGVGHLRPRDTDGPQFGGPPVNDLNAYVFPQFTFPLIAVPGMLSHQLLLTRLPVLSKAFSGQLTCLFTKKMLHREAGLERLQFFTVSSRLLALPTHAAGMLWTLKKPGMY
jgi:hypothetical protein